MKIKCFISFFSETAYMSSPCHIELILSEKEEPVKKEVGLFHVPYKVVEYCDDLFNYPSYLLFSWCVESFDIAAGDPIGH